MNTWILCANQGGARLFYCQSLADGVKLLRQFENEPGRLKTRDLVADLDDRRGHQVVAEPRQKEHIAEQFAQSLCEELEHGLSRGSCDNVILCADPHFLGLLHAKLRKTAREKVIGEVQKNFRPEVKEEVITHAIRDSYREASLRWVS